MVGKVRIIFTLALIGLSAWYYLQKIEEMKEYSAWEATQEPLIEEVREPEMLFGMVVDNYYVEKGTIQRNQSISDLLKEHNIEPAKIYDLAKASRKVFDVRRIMPHRRYALVCEPDSIHTAKVLFYEPNDIDYVIFKLDDSIKVEMNKRPVEVVEKSIGGVIQSSLAETMDQLDLSPQLTNDFADIFAWQIDFFHLYPGDQFKMIYQEQLVYGENVGFGNILGAVFTHNNEDYYAVFYDQGDGIDYFDEEGNSLRKALLKYPLKFSRISSRYSGRRYHPVQKVYKAHLGTDFAAPVGTPIRSVGDGIVVEARYGRYNGNYVKIKHNGIYSTQYLHMSRIARGIRPGTRIKQGQTIGYVGSTGLANGPHLCFRFWKNGVQVDALKVDIPPSEPIKKENLQDYLIARDTVMERLKNIEVKSTELLAGGF